jgi:NADPH-dependent curcumin reductase CurA
MTHQFLNDMTKWVKEGKIKWKETIFEGLENSSMVKTLARRW